MKHKILVILLSIAATSGAWAQSLFDQAGDAYNQQRYADAVALYDQVEEQEGVSAELYYNRGNAYYKMQKYPSAILNYERALRLSPGDDDIEYNLSLANKMIVDKISPLDQTFIQAWSGAVRDWFHSNTWAVIGIVTFMIFIIAFLFYIFTDEERMRIKKTGFYIALPMLVISVIANVCAYTQHKRAVSQEEAIIVAAQVSVKDSYSSSANEVMLLHEGVKVKLTDKLNDWIEVTTADGNHGWIHESAVEII